MQKTKRKISHKGCVVVKRVTSAQKIQDAIIDREGYSNRTLGFIKLNFCRIFQKEDKKRKEEELRNNLHKNILLYQYNAPINYRSAIAIHVLSLLSIRFERFPLDIICSSKSVVFL